MSLNQILSKYRNAAATKAEIQGVIGQYAGLSFSLKNFVFNDGSQRELVNLDGTIPIMFKSNTYNIPVCIWLMDTHPSNAPICYVKPTPEMQIKISMYVDHNGKIYLPYLHDWQPLSSDLLGLIQVMICTFGEFPPVYTKRKETVTNTPYPTQPYGIPQPGGNYLPYPGGSAGNRNNGGGSNPSAYPPYPSNNYSNFPPYPMPTNVGGGGGGGYPHPSPAATGGGVAGPGAGNYSGYNPSATTATGTGTITEEHIKASLISAVEDKLRRRIQERVNQCQAEIETLNRTKQELTEGSTKITDTLLKLDREVNDLNSNITILKERQQTLEKSLETIEKLDGIDVDEAVTTTAPIYKQLLNAYAEESAIEDTIYYLGEALRNGVIDLEIFLKYIRQLSRKQFMLRALMQKCRQTAGLAC